MQTKWELLQDEIAVLEAVRARLDERIKEKKRYVHGLPFTDLSNDEGLRCSGCNLLLKTEEHFAKHFVVPDARYPNLGECPYSEKGKEMRERNTSFSLSNVETSYDYTLRVVAGIL